ncbi:divergent PAP2 family protein [Candidatus Woesearchaeota archaeon]|jgi:uncharacterized protein|nr:divergent PAP2 family protein [Candidatus Woesearchaeota archaeon]
MLSEFFSSKIVLATAITFLICHLVKFIYDSYKSKKLSWHSWYKTGGMPSSHSASVTALTMSVALFDSINAPLFFVSLVFSIVVIRDALGVRHTVDDLIKRVNKLVKTDKINVIAGHTKSQVLVGIILGLLIPILFKLLI